MKWVIASVGLLVVIVVFSLAALDQKDVVWEGCTPHCPHCRDEVSRFAEVCSHCQRAFDWQAYERECDACFSLRDVEFIRKTYSPKSEQFIADLVKKGAEPDVVAEFELYVKELKPGACAYCGGTKKWIAPGFQDGTVDSKSPMTRLLFRFTSGMCPVCFGDGMCPQCEGERRVRCGREDSSRALDQLLARLSLLNTPHDPACAQERFRELQSYVRKHEGKEEVSLLPAHDIPDAPLLGRAIQRKRFLRFILNGLNE